MDKISELLQYVHRTNPEMTREKLIEELSKSDYAARWRRFKKLNQMTADYLDSLNLSDKERAVISETDFNCLAICFGGMLTAEEIEEDIKEQYNEED